MGEWIRVGESRTGERIGEEVSFFFLGGGVPGGGFVYHLHQHPYINSYSYL